MAASFSEISRPAVSRHLRVLREAGLVDSETNGRRHVYTATVAPLVAVTTWIDTLTPRFSHHLDALETEVHRARRERNTTPSLPATTDTDEERTA